MKNVSYCNHPSLKNKMKIIYCIHSIYNPGGMERVLLNKVEYLVSRYGWDVTIVTTNQGSRPPFYPFPKVVKMVDLGVNYSAGDDEGVLKKIYTYFQKRRLHKKRLTQLFKQEQADVVVSLFPSESSFIPEIKDGSKKVLELHFNKFFRLQYNRRGIIGLLDRFRTWQDEHLVRRFDKFVVLTEEDREYWGKLPNIEVISNATKVNDLAKSNVETKRVIAVGRLDYQKGFDRLIKAWKIVMKDCDLRDWRLDIYGQGEWKQMLEDMIQEAGLSQNTFINAPVKNIGDKYADSAFLVMSSHYEGLPMVMIEAMTYGLPVVSFDFKCGPKDIIQSNENGLLVREGDIEGLASAMKQVMQDKQYRKRLSVSALKITEKFAEDKIMHRWHNLFMTLKNS